MPSILQIIRNQKFIEEDGTLTQRSIVWAQNVTNLSILTDSGSPEGVVEAQETRFYMDTSGTAGSILYIKRDADVAGDKTKGWILV